MLYFSRFRDTVDTKRSLPIGIVPLRAGAARVTAPSRNTGDAGTRQTPSRHGPPKGQRPYGQATAVNPLRPHLASDCHSPSTSPILSCRGHHPLIPRRHSAPRSRGQRTLHIRHELGRRSLRRRQPINSREAEHRTHCSPHSHIRPQRYTPKTSSKSQERHFPHSPANANRHVGLAPPDRSAKADTPDSPFETLPPSIRPWVQADT
jgi:hypothetical protein